jgi:polyisoprenyl-phosphate glycosyltransferase
VAPSSAENSPAGPCVYSLVIPLFNEETVLPVLLHRLDQLLDKMDGPAEVIFVDDGSTDTTSIVAAARAKDDPRYRYLGFSRNFGHQTAITAGMDRASGEAVIVMDADLQDPPEVVLDLIAKWRAGYDIVYARRISREGESFLKLATAKLFYATLKRMTQVDIPQNVGDFRLVSRQALNAFRAMPERDRFVRGMFSWLGFKQTAVEFHRAPRLAGETKYGWRKMFRLAFDGVIGFSDMPLRSVLWVGSLVSGGALMFGLYVLMQALFSSYPVPGWASMAILTSFFAGMNLITTGVVGLYVGRIHNEVKQRPLYFVSREIGFADAKAEHGADAGSALMRGRPRRTSRAASRAA